jgi:hypothetical protein
MHPRNTTNIQISYSFQTPSSVTIAVTSDWKRNMMNVLPEIPILENEEMWSQRATDTPDAVLEELKQLQEQLHVNQTTTATALPKSDE